MASLRTAFSRVASRRAFSTTPRAFIKVGDSIPAIGEVLHEDSPANKVDLSRQFKTGKGIIIGVPAAFSGTCSQKHIPSYINNPQVQEMVKDGASIAVVSVNDAFV